MTTTSLSLLSGELFHVDVNGNYPALVSGERGVRIDLGQLSPEELLMLKDLAHNQYVKSMLFGGDDADVHRATLNYISRHLERAGNPAAGRAAQGVRAARARRRTRRQPVLSAA
ncbi:MAG: hypothetical protein COV99_01485 [Bacteroidetes bacterium CG12_big_fil_rev_8_21_14_0_65_60_17]|nr:MAG: hypothetical protein COV99_01485 [Bacteroidetes bacterium CG12_big_fil_rev_8_21_14_0_65_60_17]